MQIEPSKPWPRTNPKVYCRGCRYYSSAVCTHPIRTFVVDTSVEQVIHYSFCYVVNGRNDCELHEKKPSLWKAIKDFFAREKK